jgi:probable HAF family extracellular repeat protein
MEGSYHPFLFTHGRIQDLGVLQGYDGGVGGRINDRGQILINQYLFNSPTVIHRPTTFLYTDGRMLNLNELIGDPYAGVGAINNHGAIVGSIQTPGTNMYVAFIYTNGVLTRLDSLIPGGSSVALDINDAGEIAGYAAALEGLFSLNLSHAVIFSNGQITDLAVLPGLDASSAHHINRLGHVLGNCFSRATEHTRGFLYRDGHMIDVGVLPGDTDSLVIDFNNLGQIVGTSYRIENGGYVVHPVLYTDNAIWEIQTLLAVQRGWMFQAAVGINDQGQILVVVGQQDTGFQRTLLLTPHHSVEQQPSEVGFE